MNETPPLKKLSSQARASEFTFKAGFNFGLGFWVAATVFFMIIVPALACAALLTLSMAGSYLNGILN